MAVNRREFFGTLAGAVVAAPLVPSMVESLVAPDVIKSITVINSGSGYSVPYGRSPAMDELQKLREGVERYYGLQS